MIYEIKINSDGDRIDWERLLIKESDIDQIVLENDGYSIYLKRPLKYNELLGTDEEEEIEIEVIGDVQSIQLVDIPRLYANVRLEDDIWLP